MRSSVIWTAVLFSAASWVAPVPAQSPQTQPGAIQPNENLVELTDEPSRADLFKLIIAAKDRDEPSPQPGEIIPYNLYGPFAFPNDAIYDVVEDKRREKSLFGLDLSHYTHSSIPLQKLAGQQVRYIYTKATQGTTFKDGKFSDFWSRMGQLTGNARVHRGAYHFLSAAGSGVDQARTFVKFMNDNGGLKPTDMPPVLDLEWDIARQGAPDRWAGQNPDQIIQKTLDWLQFVENATHRIPMVYTSRAWWRERIGSEQKFSRLDKYKIWIADYSRSSRAVEVPKVPTGARAALWQFTESARLAGGFPGTVDANIWKGKEDDYYKEFASEFALEQFQ